MRFFGKLLVGAVATAAALGAAYYVWDKYKKEKVLESGKVTIPDDVGELNLDTDGDGKPDAVAVDIDGDGKPDAIGFDTTGDGEVDTVAADTTGDGELDTILTIKKDEENKDE